MSRVKTRVEIEPYVDFTGKLSNLATTSQAENAGSIPVIRSQYRSLTTSTRRVKRGSDITCGQRDHDDILWICCHGILIRE